MDVLELGILPYPGGNNRKPIFRNAAHSTLIPNRFEHLAPTLRPHFNIEMGVPGGGRQRMSDEYSMFIYRFPVISAWVWYCIWEDLATWKILLRCVAVIGLNSGEI